VFLNAFGAKRSYIEQKFHRSLRRTASGCGICVPGFGPNTKLSASGKPISATISVTNTGAIAQAYFADARLTKLGVMSLPGGLCAASSTLPGTGDCYNVPPEVKTVALLRHQRRRFKWMRTTSWVTRGRYGNPDNLCEEHRDNTVLASLTDRDSLWALDCHSRAHRAVRAGGSADYSGNDQRLCRHETSMPPWRRTVATIGQI